MLLAVGIIDFSRFIVLKNLCFAFPLKHMMLDQDIMQVQDTPLI